MVGCLVGWMDGWIDGCRMNECTDVEWMDGWIDEWLVGWVDGDQGNNKSNNQRKGSNTFLRCAGQKHEKSASPSVTSG